MKTPPRLVLFAALATVLAGTAHAATKTVSFDLGGFTRSYVYTAPGDAHAPMAVVLVLPDSGVDGATALDRYRWKALAASKGFIAVGLDPLPVEPAKPEMFQTNPGFWSDGSGRGNAKRGDLDDVAFARAALDDLGHRIRIDPKRIFATGFGNGGSMAHRLGAELSDRLAAIAPVAGHLWKPAVPDTPLSVLMIYGASDPADPVMGGPGINVWSHQYERRPATTSDALSWTKALACKSGPVAQPLPNNVTRSAWRGCAGDTGVDYVVVPGMGHHWPDGVDDEQPSLGPAADALDGTAFIWEWFTTHPRS